eukprot:11172616-Prorocentrum_lima.AAC.1
MTSSLVGSEMCIRDRCENVQPALSTTGNHHKKAPRDIASRKGQQHGKGCLLYTSDAADDM